MLVYLKIPRQILQQQEDGLVPWEPLLPDSVPDYMKKTVREILRDAWSNLPAKYLKNCPSAKCYSHTGGEKYVWPQLAAILPLKRLIQQRGPGLQPRAPAVLKATLAHQDSDKNGVYLLSFYYWISWSWQLNSTCKDCQYLAFYRNLHELIYSEYSQVKS